MEKIITYFLSLSLILIAGCSTKDDRDVITVEKFPQDIAIEGEYLDFEFTPYCPQTITIIESYIIIRSGRVCNDKFFYVYNKDSKEYLGSFGVEGRGPNEFQNPRLTHQYLKTDNMTGFWVYDLRNFHLINIDKSVETGETVVDSSYVGGFSDYPVSKAFLLPDGDMAGRAHSQKGRLFYYNNTNDSIKWVEYFPEVDKLPFRDEEIDNLYIGPTRISNDNSIIVSALELFKRIDVFSAKADHLFSIVMEDSPENPDFFTSPNNPIPDDLKHYYYDIYISDQHIYVLNIDLTEAEGRQELDTGYSELHVFSREGDPIALYRLNHMVFSFTIDEEEEYLYGLAPPDSYEENEHDFHLLIFEL